MIKLTYKIETQELAQVVQDAVDASLEANGVADGARRWLRIRNVTRRLFWAIVQRVIWAWVGVGILVVLALLFS